MSDVLPNVPTRPPTPTRYDIDTIFRQLAILAGLTASLYVKPGQGVSTNLIDWAIDQHQAYLAGDAPTWDTLRDALVRCLNEFARRAQCEQCGEPIGDDETGFLHAHCFPF